jgi:hypothetical protein
MFPFNHKMGQKIQTDVDGVFVDRAFDAHMKILGANAPAASNTAVHAAVNLGLEAQTVATGITNPGTPRGIRIKGNAAGVAENVVISGTNYKGEAISETIALNGASAADGAKAFKAVTSIELPAESHAHAAQVETATVVGTISTAGNATVVVTCTGMTGSPKTIPVAVALNDNAAAVAGKIRTALAADAAVTALFSVGGTGALVLLTRLTAAANIADLNVSIDNGTCAGLTTAASSANTTAGVAYDTVSIGFSDILGLPYLLPHNTVLFACLDNAREGTAPTVAVSATAIESNTIDLNSALNGKDVDIYLLV